MGTLRGPSSKIELGVQWRCSWFIVTDLSFANKSGARFRAELVNHAAGPDSFVCAST